LILPHYTVETAHALTGSAAAREIPAELVRRNYLKTLPAEKISLPRNETRRTLRGNGHVRQGRLPSATRRAILKMQKQYIF